MRKVEVGKEIFNLIEIFFSLVISKFINYFIFDMLSIRKKVFMILVVIWRGWYYYIYLIDAIIEV